MQVFVALKKFLCIFVICYLLHCGTFTFLDFLRLTIGTM